MMCESLQPTLSSLHACRVIGDAALVDTTCLYPSGKVVQVLIRQTGREYLVSDDGAAIRELQATGISVPDAAKVLRAYARKFGLSTEDGAMYETRVAAEDLPSPIRLVANASQEAVAKETDTHTFRPHRHLKSVFAEFIQTKFPDRFEHKLVPGKNRPHLFDYVYESQDNDHHLVIVDPVLRDASSINARVVAHLDVRSGPMRREVEQILVYDEEEPWSSDQLGILQLAAPAIVSFQKMEPLLRQTVRA
jgi:hypothetical protein